MKIFHFEAVESKVGNHENKSIFTVQLTTDHVVTITKIGSKWSHSYFGVKNSKLRNTPEEALLDAISAAIKKSSVDYNNGLNKFKKLSAKLDSVISTRNNLTSSSFELTSISAMKKALAESIKSSSLTGYRLPDASDLVLASRLNDELDVVKLNKLRPLALEVLSNAGICSCGTKRTFIERCPLCSTLWPSHLPRFND